MTPSAARLDPGLRRVLGTALLAHLAALGLLVLGYLFLVGGAPDALTLVTRAVVRWDAKHYLAMAGEAYRNPDVAPFFPLYPATVALFGLIFDLTAAALIVSAAAHLCAAGLLYQLVRLDQPRAVAFRAVVFLLAFPTGFAAVLPYTEGLFLALTLGCLYAFRRERFALAGVLGALAAATRLNGLVLGPALLVEFWMAQRGRVRTVPALLACAAPALGFLAYLAVNQAAYGDPLFFMRVSATTYTKTLAWPQVGLRDGIGNLQRDVPENITIGFCDLLGVALAWAAGIYAAFRLRASDAAFALLSALLITVQSWWLSSLRYAFVIVPMYAMLGRVTGRPWWLRAALVCACLVLQAMLILQFSRGHWTM